MSAQSEQSESKPTIIYSEGVNVTTPYIININPSVYALMLRNEFQLSEGEIGKVGVHVLADKGPLYRASSSRITTPVLGQSEFLRKIGNQRFKQVVTLFMGTTWEQTFSPKYGNLFTERSRWEETRKDIFETLAHEASHVKDLNDFLKGLSNTISSDLMVAGFSLATYLLGKGAPKSTLTKVSKMGETVTTANAILQTLQLTRNGIHYAVSNEPRAEQAGKSADITKWPDLVSLSPNPATQTPLERFARRFIHL
ncbi:MAG: hypothetical protein Q7R49_03315 [Candidatus Daviesbacteria bacterium]|nr:hypothetical protein [Candidatus Daviesbacteria bacterium]